MGIATRGSVLAIGFCFPIICGILVATRFYVRWHQKVSWRIDDWLCLPAWLFLTGCCVALLTGVFKDAFVKTSLTSVAEQERVLAQVTGALQLFWIASNTLIKLSILFFYRRIFMGRVFSICNRILIGLSFVWLVYAFVACILYCGTNLHRNFEGGWASCDSWGLTIQTGVFCLDTFIDFFLLILPVPSVWKLQSSVSRKLTIVMIFLLGGFAFVAGLNNTIVQMVMVTDTQSLITESGGKSNFFSNSYLLVYAWPTVEIGVGLIACNLPSLSSRAAEALPKQIQRGWNLSLSGIRYVVVRLFLRSDPRRNHIDTHLAKTSGDRTTSNRYEGRYRLPGYLEQQGSTATITIENIPLVHIGSQDNVSSETRPAEGSSKWLGFRVDEKWKRQEQVIRGFDAV